ncbi:MAG: T9SS type A sorting domain-containing protein [Bacteroidales bacterium]|nr:T9SS type A sorting domain-containing protein [Bacteroidales bacterium]
MKNLILLLVLAFLYGPTAQAQITRGAQPGEIYISINWYIDNSGNLHDAIFRSTDNGENLTLQYETLYNPPPDEMRLGRVLGDATLGALYNWGWNELWVSFDYGVNWEYREDYSYANYATGFSNGEIYRRSDYNLYRSENYGETFELIVESLSEPLSDIGNQAGELFGFTGSAGIGYNLYHSSDYGNFFTIIPIDSIVAFWQIGSYYPQISRGTEPGELYLMSWWPGSYYKIFHSIDTGYSWTEKFESGYIDIYYWGVSYTAGRDPGSFYVTRSTQDPTQFHAWLYIDYSSDYGETFTTYFHDLDSLYTGIQNTQKPDFISNSYPNPFTDKTTITFTLPLNSSNCVLQIFNIKGELIRKYTINGKNKQQWDGKDNNGNLVPNGIYFYHIKTGSFSSQFHKLLFIH